MSPGCLIEKIVSMAFSIWIMQWFTYEQKNVCKRGEYVCKGSVKVSQKDVYKRQQQHMRFTMRSRIRDNEPVIAKCITWNNSLVLVFVTNDITLYLYKNPTYIFEKTLVCAKHARFYYASGRSPIYLVNIYLPLNILNPSK